MKLLKYLGFCLTLLASTVFVRASGAFDGISTPVNHGSVITANGWGADYIDGANTHVYIYIGPNYVGEATMGGNRPDVQEVNVANGNIFSWQDVTYSGWNFSYNSSPLVPGTHSMTAHVLRHEFDGDGGDYFWEEDIGTKTFEVTVTLPEVQGVSGTNISYGQSTTLTGRATDQSGNLGWIYFWVSGPTLPGWNYVGRSAVSGSDATGTLSWTPPLPGNFAVHVEAHNLWDQNGIVGAGNIAGFSVSEPTIAPSGSAQDIYPSGSLTFAHVGDTIIIPQRSTWVYDEYGGYYEYSDGEIDLWASSSWQYLGNYPSYTATSPGIYLVEGGLYVCVLNPPTTPTVTIAADSTSINLGESTTIHAIFSAGQYDSLTGYNIDYPLYTGLPNQSEPQPAHRDYVFTPTASGSYTFYARAETVCFPWQTYSTVTVEVTNPASTSISASASTVNAGNNFTVTATTTSYTGALTSQGIDYSTDGGNSWTGGSIAAGSRWEGNATSNTLTATFNFNSPSAVVFRARGQIASGAMSAFVTATVNINHPPVTTIGLTTSSITLGQEVTITAVTTDVDGNLTNQTIDYLAPGSSTWVSGWSVSGANWSGSSTGSHSLSWTMPAAILNTAGVWQVRAAGGDGMAVSNYPSSSITVGKATPVISQFSNQTYTTVHTVTAGDLNAAFSNPYSGSVTQPTGAATYTIVSGGSGILTVGSVLLPGSYTIRASYSGDANYNPSAPADVVWTEVLADTFVYDDAGRLTSVTQANGLNHSYTPDEEANLQTVGHSATDTTYLGGAGNGIADWWEVANFGAPGIDPLATPASDGISNLMKYMLGKDPLAVLTGPLVTASQLAHTDGNMYPLFTYTAAKDAVATLYMQQSSDGGATWQSGSAYFAQMSATDLGDGTVQIVVRCLTPMPGAANLLFRLKADGGISGIAAYNTPFSLPAEGFPVEEGPGNDVPTMPNWALAGLGVLLLLTARHFLRPAPSAR